MTNKRHVEPSRKRRQFLKVVGSGAAMAGLAGCTDSGSNDGGDGGGDGGSGDGGDGGGGGGAVTGQDIEGPIKIGTLSPTQEQIFGITVPNGAKVAAQEINENGGVAGADLEVISKNTEGDPQKTQSLYRELTLQEEVDVVLGPLSSEAAINLLPTVAEQKVLTINSAAGTERLGAAVSENYEKYKYQFNTGPLNGYYQGVNMLDFAEAYFSDLPWDSVAYVSEGRAWSEAQHELISEELENTVDMEVVEIIRYSGGTEDFTSIYDRVEQSGADGMFASIAYTTVTAVTQWSKQQRPFGFLGNFTSLMPSAIYGALEGAPRYTASVNYGSVPGVEVGPKTLEFQERYDEEYGGNPTFPGYNSYDAVHMFAKAVENTGSLSTSETIPELEGMSHGGAAGTIEFYGEGEPYRHDPKYGEDLYNPVWFQWKEQDGEGVQVPIWPDGLAEGEYESPSWK
jgi:branched-chain amino acid transport system substrate-binding protein